ncbi:Polysialic acid transport protein KpsD [Myxococcaceae bacterium]|jgi:polysaccharide export outer membrane protein|nr:Polysialic acid transport protein KpsD [Myxococcaceae bacterium]
MKGRFHRVLALSCVLAFAAVACGRAVQPPPPEPAGGEKTPYVIGPSDLLQVTVWKNPELSLDQVPVRPDGRISVPLANDVQAAGLTTDELKQVLTEKLAEYVTAPDVTVVVLQVNSRRVYVLGEVNRPGPVSLATDTRVLDAISSAGGFSTFADRDRVKVIRRGQAGAVTEYRFSYSDFVEGTVDNANMLLENGDTVVVSD